MGKIYLQESDIKKIIENVLLEFEDLKFSNPESNFNYEILRNLYSISNYLEKINGIIPQNIKVLHSDATKKMNKIIKSLEPRI